MREQYEATIAACRKVAADPTERADMRKAAAEMIEYYELLLSRMK